MPATKAKTKRIIELLIQAYNAELETVMNFMANAANLDGVRAQEIRESLEGDVTEEIGHVAWHPTQTRWGRRSSGVGATSGKERRPTGHG